MFSGLCLEIQFMCFYCLCEGLCSMLHVNKPRCGLVFMSCVLPELPVSYVQCKVTDISCTLSIQTALARFLKALILDMEGVKSQG